MNQLVILSSTTTKGLLLEAEKYDLIQVGSLSVSNGEFFLSALGVPKVEPKLTNVTLAPAQLELPLEDTQVSKSAAKRVAAQKR
jgi:hypothetical protein